MKDLYHITRGLCIALWQTIVVCFAFLGLIICGTLLALAHLGKR